MGKMKKSIVGIFVLMGLAALALLVLNNAPEKRPVEPIPLPTAVEPATAPPIENGNHVTRSQIMGTVALNDTGRAGVGVQVRLLKKAKLGDKKDVPGGQIPVRHWFLQKEKTNLAGRFSFNKISPGDYFLEASREGYATSRIVLTIFSEEEKLQPTIRLFPGATLQIQVISQQRLKGAQGILLHPGDPPRVQSLDEKSQTIFRDLSPGNYWFRLEASLANINLYHWQSFNNQFPTEVDIVLKEGESKEWKIQAGGEKPGNLTGVVIVQGADPNQEFIVTASIVNQSPQLSRYPIQPLQQRIKNGASFRFKKIPSGEYQIWLGLVGGQGQQLAKKNIQVGGTETISDFSLQVGSVIGLLQKQSRLAWATETNQPSASGFRRQNRSRCFTLERRKRTFPIQAIAHWTL